MRTLKLKSYEVPGDPNAAKQLCHEVIGDLENLHQYRQEQVKWLKRQYQMALRRIRPELVTEDVLRELFDEPEMTADPDDDTEVEEKGGLGKKGKKNRSKKRKAIPDHLPRIVVEHDVAEGEKKCGEDGSELSSMGYDTKLELKYIPA